MHAEASSFHQYYLFILFGPTDPDGLGRALPLLFCDLQILLELFGFFFRGGGGGFDHPPGRYQQQGRNALRPPEARKGMKLGLSHEIGNVSPVTTTLHPLSGSPFLTPVSIS